MNFKVNAWTWLFVLAVIVAAYCCMCECAPAEDVLVTAHACKSCDPPPENYRIPPGQANNWIKSYERYANTLTDTTVVKNPNVRYFQLPRCEMVEMINEVGEDSDVRAHLAIDANNGLIKIVFQDIPKKGRTEASGDGGFFDFTQPCPTFCEE